MYTCVFVCVQLCIHVYGYSGHSTCFKVRGQPMVVVFLFLYCVGSGESNSGHEAWWLVNVFFHDTPFCQSLTAPQSIIQRQSLHPYIYLQIQDHTISPFYDTTFKTRLFFWFCLVHLSFHNYKMYSHNWIIFIEMILWNQKKCVLMYFNFLYIGNMSDYKHSCTGKAEFWFLILNRYTNFGCKVPSPFFLTSI